MRLAQDINLSWIYPNIKTNPLLQISALCISKIFWSGSVWLVFLQQHQKNHFSNKSSMKSLCRSFLPHPSFLIETTRKKKKKILIKMCFLRFEKLFLLRFLASIKVLKDREFFLWNLDQVFPPQQRIGSKLQILILSENENIHRIGITNSRQAAEHHHFQYYLQHDFRLVDE